PYAAYLAAGGLPSAQLTGALTDGSLLVKVHGKSLTKDPRLKTYEAYSLGDLILSYQALEEKRKPTLAPELFKDKLVFVGMSAAGLLDNRPSPISQVFPGTEIIASATDNLLNQDFLTTARPLWLGALVLCAL